MAEVFSNHMVAHVWANQSQESGRSNNGQFYFNGRAIFSYGSHFVAGFIMADGAALINSDTYSITTSRHSSHVRNAARHRECYSVPNLTKLYNDALRYLEHRDGKLSADERKRFFAFMGDNVLSMSEESARYLLRFIGRESSFDKIKRDAEKKRAKAKADERKREIALRLYSAKSFDKMSDSDFMSVLDELETKDVYRHRSWDERRAGKPAHALPSELFADYGRDIWRYQESAKLFGTAALAKRIGARLKIIRQRKRDAEKAERRGAELQKWMQAKRRFRDLMARRDKLSRQENVSLGQIARAFGTYDSALISQESRVAWLAVADDCEARERLAVETETRERMEREREARDAWLAGNGPRYWRGSDERNGALLRATGVERDESGAIIGGKLETSHGAECPLPHALKAFAFVRACVAAGKEWHANGKTIRVGHFRVNSISADGTMTAGCHTIHFAEMERLAAVLEVSDIKPSDAALEDSGHGR